MKNTLNKIEISCDDGSLYDIQVANLLMMYGLKGVFYIPNNCELSPYQIRWLVNNGMEIGGHTVHHPVLRDQSPEIQYWEIKTNKDWIEEIIGKRIHKFCYPKGKYDDVTVEQVKKAGFTSARTTDVFKSDGDPFRQGVNIHVYPTRKEYTKHWLEHAKEQFDKEKGTYRVFIHGWELTKHNLWDEFEELLQYVSK